MVGARRRRWAFGPTLVSWSLGAFCAVCAGLAGAAPAAEDSAAVVLSRPLLLPPLEAAGTGLAPEVRVRVTVDARGSVAAVEVLAVAPASPLDQVFVEHTMAELAEWRFAPARADGAPVESTIVLSVQYRAVASTEEPKRSRDPLLLAHEDPRAFGAELLLLPPHERQERLERYAQAAERHLNSKRRTRFDSPRFVVVTDAEDPATAEIVAGNLEASFNILHRLFDAAIAPQPERYKLVAYLFADRSAFRATAIEIRGEDTGEGFYGAPGFLAFHQEALPDSLLGTMLHEATHAFVDRHLRKAGVSLPLWFEEGIAEYLGNSQITRKGELVTGKTVRRKIVLAHSYGPIRLTTDAGFSLDALRMAMRTGEAPTLERLVAATPPVFYGDKSHLHYALSWLFVHFLRHASAGWEARFPELVLYLAEGYPPDEAIVTVYGTTLERLGPSFSGYVKGF